MMRRPEKRFVAAVAGSERPWIPGATRGTGLYRLRHILTDGVGLARQAELFDWHVGSEFDACNNTEAARLQREAAFEG